MSSVPFRPIPTSHLLPLLQHEHFYSPTSIISTSRKEEPKNSNICVWRAQEGRLLKHCRDPRKPGVLLKTIVLDRQFLPSPFPQEVLSHRLGRRRRRGEVPALATGKFCFLIRDTVKLWWPNTAARTRRGTVAADKSKLTQLFFWGAKQPLAGGTGCEQGLIFIIARIFSSSPLFHLHLVDPSAPPQLPSQASSTPRVLVLFLQASSSSPSWSLPLCICALGLLGTG